MILLIGFHGCKYGDAREDDHRNRESKTDEEIDAFLSTPKQWIQSL